MKPFQKEGRLWTIPSFFGPNGQDMAPSVIYIDQVEQVFQATKKKKGADSGTAPSRIKKDLRWLLDDREWFTWDDLGWSGMTWTGFGHLVVGWWTIF